MKMMMIPITDVSYSLSKQILNFVVHFSGQTRNTQKTVVYVYTNIRCFTYHDLSELLVSVYCTYLKKNILN